MDVYLSLFLAAILSATLLPGTSEVLLISLLSQGYEPFILWCWATAGNTLGSVVNWWLGLYLLHYKDRRWFPFKQEALDKSQRWFQRYGLWSLLLAWAPVIGDGITFIAGIMRIHFLTFFILVFISKGTRYALLVGIIDIINQMLFVG